MQEGGTIYLHCVVTARALETFWVWGSVGKDIKCGDDRAQKCPRQGVVLGTDKMLGMNIKCQEGRTKRHPSHEAVWDRH